MKNDRLLWALLGFLLLGGGGVAVFQMTRGLRNNNPGNIRKGDAWQGMAAEQNDPDFVTFVSPEWGLRAMGKILINYFARGIDTPREIAYTWAPPFENDSLAYAQSLADTIGVGLDTPLILATHGPSIIAGLTKQENGLNPYSADTIRTGLQMAYNA